MRSKIILALVIFSQLLILNVKAAVYEYSRNDIHIQISKDYNWLSLGGLYLHSVSGDANFAEFTASDISKMVFIVPKILGKHRVTIITNTGEMQNIVFNVKDIEPQTIFINMPILNNYLNYKKDSTSLQQICEDIKRSKIQYEPLEYPCSLTIDDIECKKIGFFLSKGFIVYLYSIGRPLEVIQMQDRGNAFVKKLADRDFLMFDWTRDKKLMIFHKIK